MRCPGAAVALALAACGSSGAAVPEAAIEPADFQVRGRCAEPVVVRYHVDAERAPVPAADFAAAVAQAAAVWTATGVVRCEAATDAAAADVVLSFRRGHHGACEPFGPLSDVAHTGPMTSPTFVHFDAGRRWSADGGDGHSVFHVALHELGHVFGLGHAEAADAVMGNDPLRPAALSRHDLAGLHSLYGGGVDGHGDLRIVTALGEVSTVLRAVAPPASCAWTVADADGDGRSDVLVWRTDAAGHGALRVFVFGAGPRLARTIGPFPGVIAAGATVGVVTGPDGERLLVSSFATAPRQVRQFDAHGVPGLPAKPFPEDLLARAARTDVGDLDGDGRSERVRPGAR